MGLRSSVTLWICFLVALSCVHAHPTHQSRKRKAIVDFDSFRLRSSGSYVSVDETRKRSLQHGKRATNLETATSFIQSTFAGYTFRLMPDHYVGTNGVEHFYFKQVVNNIDIDNADLNINVAADGKILAYAHSVYQGSSPPSSTLIKRDFVGPLAALKQVSRLLNLPITVDGATAKLTNEIVGLEDAPDKAAASEPTPFQGSYVIEGVQGAYQDPKARLVYLQSGEGIQETASSESSAKANGTLDLVWKVETDIREEWVLSYVEATKGETINGVVNYVAHSRYQVYPWQQRDPLDGLRVLEIDPYDRVASPLTWNIADATGSQQTVGNNGKAQSNFNSNDLSNDDLRPVSVNGDFVYDLDLNSLNPSSYINASVTQLFYTANMMHDLLYTLGFNEAAGNFQEDNEGKGGVQGDGVTLFSQDASSLNNAFFFTPPDGQAGRMSMFLWGVNGSSVPLRDSSFDSDIVVHEYTHGLSNRLTGGPSNSGCLASLESSGLGEGWSDFFATAVNLNPNTTTRMTPRPIGAWVNNNPIGVRTVPYTSNFSLNSLTYSRINGLARSHDIGTVWCSILHEVLWDLIASYGINPARKPRFLMTTANATAQVPDDGRYLAMKLAMDGMALQGCNPGMLEARNGILDADRVLTGGKNQCILWTAFARRGLGVEATAGGPVVTDNVGGVQRLRLGAGRVDSFGIPQGC